MLSPRVSSIFLLFLFLLAGCRTKPQTAAVIDEAYVGPATLNLRGDLAPGSPVTASVKHGERVEILQRRRRFVKVRTAQGAEGWTDSRQLLSPAQMADLRRNWERYAKLPSQGSATVYDALNVHIEPNRQSPSFYQVPEAGSVEVIGHRVAPRSAPPAPAPPAPPKAAKKAKEKERDSPSRVPPPPPPSAPKLPDNWLDLSRSAAPADLPDSPAGADSVKPAPAVRLEDWSLVRTRDGKVGWVLTRALTMAIPDEVAQYAEGHRITSYFSLGRVSDGDATKHNWLWTTISTAAVPYEFDSFRVFIWSLRHHRYETAYIERNVKGYFPVEVHPVSVREGKKTSTGQGFSLILEDSNSGVLRRTYAFQGYRVRMVAKAPYERSAEPPPARDAEKAEAPAASPPKSFGARWRERLSGWWARLVGK